MSDDDSMLLAQVLDGTLAEDSEEAVELFDRHPEAREELAAMRRQVERLDGLARAASAGFEEEAGQVAAGDLELARRSAAAAGIGGAPEPARSAWPFRLGLVAAAALVAVVLWPRPAEEAPRQGGGSIELGAGLLAIPKGPVSSLDRIELGLVLRPTDRLVLEILDEGGQQVMSHELVGTNIWRFDGAELKTLRAMPRWSWRYEHRDAGGELLDSGNVSVTLQP